MKKEVFDKKLDEEIKSKTLCSFCGKEHDPEKFCAERKRIMQASTTKNTGKDKPTCAVCTSAGKFYSRRLEKSFCTDKCYETYQRGDDPSKPHIVVTRKNGAFFEQGDIRVQVDEHDLDKVLGAGSFSHEPSVVEKLMDSQVVALATANGLKVSPFVRHLVTRPLHGIIQFVWYRDLKHNVDFAHLMDNQRQRVKDYDRMLAEYKPDEDGTGLRPRKEGSKRVSKKSAVLTASYRVTKKKVTLDKGRATDLYNVILAFKDGATFPQLVEAAKDKVKTKQPLEKIVARFLGVLEAEGAVEKI